MTHLLARDLRDFSLAIAETIKRTHTFAARIRGATSGAEVQYHTRRTEGSEDAQGLVTGGSESDIP